MTTLDDSARIPQRRRLGGASGTEPQGEQNAPAGLEWFEPGVPAYHIESKCGRYTVSRMTVSARETVYYIAWRVTRGEKNRIVKRTELGSAPIPLEHTAEQRTAAREAMKQRCADDARSNSAERVPAPRANQEISDGQDEEEHREETHAP